MSENRSIPSVPLATIKALDIHKWQIDNIALLLNKYLDFLPVNNEYQIKEPNKISELKNKSFFPLIRYKQIPKSLEEEVLKKMSRNFRQENQYNNLKEYRGYILSLISKGEIRNLINKVIYRQENISDENFELTTQSRLVVGLGGSSVLETSIKLHHIYGIPYIPSSAIKGVLRAYKIWILANWKEEEFSKIEKNIENNKPSNENEKKLIEIFGNQQQKGKLIIFDAYPTNFEGFDIDIMNPHFPDYYDKNKNQPPADWQSPNPVTFLTIPEKTKFKFFFKNTSLYKKYFGNDLKQDLKNALEYIGIGAKTSIGYGILTDKQ